MAVTTYKTFSMPVASRLMDAVRGVLGKAQLDAPVVKAVADPVPEVKLSVEQDRYARFLDHELDRSSLTEVEREDSEMLARVRDALYADD